MFRSLRWLSIATISKPVYLSVLSSFFYFGHITDEVMTGRVYQRAIRFTPHEVCEILRVPARGYEFPHTGHFTWPYGFDVDACIR
ncbi:hypothetical protein, partial [Heyndrickxia coagulans]|uniref:hypothetical protein n=1 Tax=Heyndrickxia coagulans TaxID=1398 RepID=UPI00214D31AD